MSEQCVLLCVVHSAPALCAWLGRPGRLRYGGQCAGAEAGEALGLGALVSSLCVLCPVCLSASVRLCDRLRSVRRRESVRLLRAAHFRSVFCRLGVCDSHTSRTHCLFACLFSGVHSSVVSLLASAARACVCWTAPGRH